MKGTKTSNGTEIELVHSHACDRMVEHGISSSKVKKILETATITYPGNKESRTYQHDGWRIVVDNDKKQARTVVNLENDDDE